MNKKRELWADIVRILAIFFIILLHTSQFLPGTDKGTFPHLMIIILGTFGVPVFIILSGYLLLGKLEPELSFFKKRLRRVIVPWLTWSVVFVLFEHLLINNFHSLSEVVVFYKIRLQSFWFIPLILSLYALTPLLRIYVSKSNTKHLIYLLALWFISISLFPILINSQAFPLYVDSGIVRLSLNFIGYFLFGNLIYKNRKKNINPKFVFVIFMFSILAVLFLSYYIKIEYTSYVSPLIIISSFSLFSFLFLYLRKIKVKNMFFMQTLIKISNMSLGIYFIHELILLRIIRGYYGNDNILNFSNPINGLLNALIIFFLSIVMLSIIGKISKLRKLFI